MNIAGRIGSINEPKGCERNPLVDLYRRAYERSFKGRMVPDRL